MEITATENHYALNCVLPENIHSPPKDGHWKFRGEGGSQKPKFLKESMKESWKFLVGGRVQTKKKHLWGRYGYFLELHIASQKRQ